MLMIILIMHKGLFNSNFFICNPAFTKVTIILERKITVLANSACDLSGNRTDISRRTAKVPSLWRERFPGQLISYLPTLTPETKRFSESRTHMQRFLFSQSISLE